MRSAASSTTTSSPARASRTAATSPLWPAPTTTTVARAGSSVARRVVMTDQARGSGPVRVGNAECSQVRSKRVLEQRLRVGDDPRYLAEHLHRDDAVEPGPSGEVRVDHLHRHVTAVLERLRGECFSQCAAWLAAG